MLECYIELGVPLYRRSRSVPRWPWIGSPATAVLWLQGYVAATSACRRLEDKLGLFRGELARWSGSGGTFHGRSLLRMPACHQGALTAML